MLNPPETVEWLPLDPEAAILDMPTGGYAKPFAGQPYGGAERPFGESVAAALQTTWLQMLLCVAAALPLVWPEMPPLTDLGGHLGRFAVQLNGGTSASLAQWYSFHWHVIPNLGADLLMQVLAPHIGLEAALKAIVIAIVVLQTAGLLMLAKIVHGHVPPTALLALPLVYGYPFQYGFINFSLCTALGTWALALWVHLDRPGLRLPRWLAFAPIACALWVCHFAGYALFCTFAAGVEFAGWRDRELSWRDAARRAAVPLSCLIVPCLMFAFWPHVAGAPGVTQGWFDWIGKLGMFVMALRDRWAVWDIASALALVGMIAWTWHSRSFSRHSGLVLAAVFAAAAFAILPKHVNGTSFVDMRLVPMILAIALVAVRPRQDCPRRIVETLALAALLFCGARFVGNAASLALYGTQFADDLAVLESMPRDAQLITLTLKPCVANEPWQRERRTHLAGYALARRHDFANDQWFAAGGQLLRVHNQAAGAFVGDPSETSSPTACRGKPAITDLVATVPQAVPYLWLIEDGIVRDFSGWTAIRKSAGSVLYTRLLPGAIADAE